MIGENLLRLQSEHQPVIQELQSLIKCFPSKMILPLRTQSEQFRTKLSHLEKLHSKSYKQKRNLIKQKKTDLKKVEKKLGNKGRIL